MKAFPCSDCPSGKKKKAHYKPERLGSTVERYHARTVLVKVDSAEKAVSDGVWTVA